MPFVAISPMLILFRQSRISQRFSALFARVPPSSVLICGSSSPQFLIPNSSFLIGAPAPHIRVIRCAVRSLQAEHGGSPSAFRQSMVVPLQPSAFSLFNLCANLRHLRFIFPTYIQNPASSIQNPIPNSSLAPSGAFRAFVPSRLGEIKFPISNFLSFLKFNASYNSPFRRL